MKETGWKKLAGIAAGVLALLSIMGCGGAGEKEEIYPLTVDGTAITLDETTMQTIYDAGFEVSVLDTSSTPVQWYEVEADMPLDAESVYTGIYIGRDGVKYASVSIVTEDACAMKDGVIYALRNTEDGLDKVTISSVLLTDLTEEKAKEIESRLEANEYFQSYVTDYKILRIKRENGDTGAVTEMEVEVRYEIDYTG